MIKFIVDEMANQKRASKPIWRAENGLSVPKTIQRVLRGNVPEAYGANLPDIIPARSHALIEAMTLAYEDHYPLVLSPDDIWMVLSQSFAKHVDQNAEKLRHQFVQHEGKVKIVWRNDSLVKGSPDNNWMDGFHFFADKIKEHIGKKHDLLTANFTTSGPIEIAASQVVLMEAMKHYFEYGVMTMCGIPEITLLGETSDWQSIRNRVQTFAEFNGLAAWSNRLDPILAEFVNASQGNIDQAFAKYDYEFLAGFVGIHQDPETLAVRAGLGWAVREAAK